MYKKMNSWLVGWLSVMIILTLSACGETSSEVESVDPPSATTDTSGADVESPTATVEAQPTATPELVEATVEPPTATVEEPTAEPSSGETEGTGAAGTPITTEEGAGDNSLAGFEEMLKEAVVTHNYELMMLNMDDPFTFGWWRLESESASPNEAIDSLRTNYILPENTITFSEQPLNLRVLLYGIDPWSTWGEGVNVVSALSSTGWGVDGNAEAFLIITQHPDGHFSWNSVLLRDGTGVNGVSITTEEDAADYSLASFEERLKKGIITHNYQLMMLNMDDPFAFGFWRSEGYLASANEAVDTLRNNYILPESSITFPDPPPDLTALLGGIDPLTMWGPDVNTVSALYSTGWGADGNTEGILIIAQDPDGYFYWDSVLIAPFGFRDGTGAAGMPITTEEGAGDNSLVGFEEMLKEAVVTHNYELMMLNMDDPFGFGFWLSEGYPASPNQAVETLRTNYILPESTITFPEPPTDLTALLGGLDPLSMWEPSVNVVSALYSTGWGADGNGEAMLMIAQHPDGYYYWYSVLIAPSGFRDGTGAAGTPITTEEGAGDNSLAGFEEMLKEAVVTHNYELMMLTMGDPFGFGFWLSEGYPASPNQAVETLRTNYILPENTITFPEPPTDLGGIDPLSIWPPEINIVSALYSTGWGADANGEAMLIIAQHPDGDYYWYSVLIAPSGF